MQHDKSFFPKLREASLPFIPAILQRMLPGGKVEGCEYLALNPKRADGTLGSFKINMRTGRWSDFAVQARGSDIISLAAYLFDVPQYEAAKMIERMIGRGNCYE